VINRTVAWPTGRDGQRGGQRRREMGDNMLEIGNSEYKLHETYCQYIIVLIANFRRVLNVVCFLLGNSPASEFYIPTFRNTLFHLHKRIGMNND
jgi:hypothetical protein